MEDAADLLLTELYSLNDAASLLGVPPSTLYWWLDGGKRHGKQYPPVIRPESTGSRIVNWAEFIEAGLLRQYRAELGVKLSELRGFIDRLRESTGVQYPLAFYKPWVGEGQQLMLELQLETELAGDLWLIAPASNQLVMTDIAASFLRRVDWEDGRASAWRPHDDPRSPVRCSPTSRFGRPAIGGISTEAIVEHLAAGEDAEEVAEQFDLTVEEVQWASAYELSHRADQLAVA
jgi:uncharacterized protein (DUF433 family)